MQYAQLQRMPRLPLTEVVPLKGPFTIYLEPTNICNFKCTFCPESFADYKETVGGHFQMAMEDFERVARQIKAIGTLKTLNFYMLGEPFANKKLTDFIAFAKRESISERIIVTSNGTLVRPERYAAILESGLDFLRISIYGGDQARHAERTKSPIKLERIRDNILGLKRARDEAGLKSPVIYVKMIESEDPAENAAFKSYFDGVGDELELEPVMNWNDPTEGNLSGLAEEELLHKTYFSKPKEVCAFPFYTLVIHSDLKVSVCCVDWNKKTVVGNLREQTLEQIWRGDRLHQFQLMHLERRRAELDGCRDCSFLHTARDNLDALSPDDYRTRLQQEGG